MTHCPLCGSQSLRLTVKLKGDVKIYVCQNCKSGITLPRPQVNYDEHQFFSLASSNLSRWRLYSNQIVKFIQKNNLSTGTLLDVGCSHGLLIEEANKLGFVAEGIEPSKPGFDFCRSRGLNVKHGYLVSGIYPNDFFDVIVMAHVLEHIPDPYQLLVIARDILKPGGIICLSQTNYLGTLPNMLRRYWGYWIENEHYYHFSPHSITYILQKAGFKLLKIETTSLDYPVNFIVENPKSILRILMNIFKLAVSRFKIGFPFQGDQMYILAYVE